MKNAEFLGRMRERVTFEAFTGLDDGMGGMTRGWQRVADGWAAIEMVAVKEDTVAQQHTRAIRYRMVARRPAGLSPAWRVRWRNRLLGITALADVDGRPELVLLQAREEAVS